jgi:hypothetical protein
MKRPIGTAVVVLAAMVMADAWAQGKVKDEDLGEFGDWRAQTFTENGKPVCTAWSQPTNDEGDYSKRGAIYAYVTHRPAQKRLNEVQIVAGYRYKKGSEVHVRIGGETFKLFTRYDAAWARSPAVDRKLVGAMRRGNSMIVTGISGRGTDTTDTYSLKGITAAHDAINKACGVSWK